MYSEDDLLPLSALQHYLFCKRQCALIHVEQQWVENLFTAEGRIMHERVDQSGGETRGGLRIDHGLPLRSLRLGLIGKADVVEFHRQEDGNWIPFPVEYKRGKTKKENWDKVQLCAQAICLEEMLGASVPEGALFYGRNRRRLLVGFDELLRAETESTAMSLHKLVASGKTPRPVYTKLCDSCSFVDVCRPKTLEKRKRIDEYLFRL
ncbi:MAG: CRISPR-associated protein Cas4 [Proteobacteria bacterium]|nr:CRISPR-associated protein Cas4 [Pseudomonadota bacterium]MBU1710752.1 CRISPR-associated protein Cas4 [Pseudomonadota bacterium]